MTAQERLAAALSAWPEGERDAEGILAADPTLAQDIEDGRALRELREALPEGWRHRVIGPLAGVYSVAVLDHDGWQKGFWNCSSIAAAADACREAL